MSKAKKILLVDRIKIALQKSDEVERNVANQIFKQLKQDIEAKVEDKIANIQEMTVTFREVNMVIGHNFICPNNIVNDVEGLLRQYLIEQGFVKITFKNMSDANSIGHSGLVQFTIPD